MERRDLTSSSGPPGTSSQLQQQPVPMATIMKERAEEHLKKHEVKEGPTVMAEKKPPGTAGQQIRDQLRTNIFPVEIDENLDVRFYCYVTSLQGIYHSQDRVDDFNLRRDFFSDYYCVARRDKMLSAFLCWRDCERDLLDTLSVKNVNLLYDFQQFLFSTKDIPIPKEGREYTFGYDEMNAKNKYMDDKRFKFFKFKIIRAEKYHLSLKDMVNYIRLTRDVSKIDRSYQQLVEVASSQMVLLDRERFIAYSVSAIYSLFPASIGYGDDDCPKFKNNHTYLGIGFRTAAHLLEGQNGRGDKNAGLVLMNKKTAFHFWDKAKVKAEAVCQAILTERVDLHSAHNLLAIENAFKGLFSFDHFIKFSGLCVETLYNPGVVYCVVGLSTTNARNQRFPFKNNNGQIEMVSIEEYYERKWNVVLQHPYAPLLIFRMAGNKDGFLPIETVEVCDNQRVKGRQQHSLQMKEMIKRTAIPPIEHVRQNELNRNALKLEDNDYLKEAGIKINSRPLHVVGRQLNHPSVEYADRKHLDPSKDRASWTFDGWRFFQPAQYQGEWVAYAFINRDDKPDKQITREAWGEFVKQYHREMVNRGVRNLLMATHVEVLIYKSSPQHTARGIIEKHALNGTEFALVCHPSGSTGDEIHEDIKYLERTSKIITQGVEIDTVKKAMAHPEKRLVVSNLVMKANIKRGGHNYMLLISERDMQPIMHETLFIGFAMNHPAPQTGRPPQSEEGGKNGNGNGKEPKQQMGGGGNGNGNGQKRESPPQQGPSTVGGEAKQGTPPDQQKQPSPSGGSPPQQGIVPQPKLPFLTPSVLGWSANIGPRNNLEFIGDFVFQECRRQENYWHISSVMELCLQKYIQRRGKNPNQVIIFHNACAEGQLQGILKYEVPPLRAILNKMKLYNTKLLIIGPNKMQGVRFTRTDINETQSPTDQNIRPGTVIDTGAVHPEWDEFYLNSHLAIQGTARTPIYKIIHDELHLTPDQQQKMVHYLCFAHQIVCSPTSLPTPVYVAEEYAKRGRNQYNVYTKNLAVYQQNNNNGGNAVIGNNNNLRAAKDLVDLTKMLSYAGTEYLPDLRINA